MAPQKKLVHAVPATAKEELCSQFQIAENSRNSFMTLEASELSVCEHAVGQDVSACGPAASTQGQS